MTWEIVAGIITLISAAIALGGIIAKNTKAMTQNTCSLNSLTETVKEQGQDIKSMAETINDHETRIRLLEHDKEE